jgi:ATP-dependent exoDNAse (exonuclease V) beta subunit
VWWDPQTLGLGVAESVGLRQQRLLEADAAGLRAEESIRAHEAWQSERSQVRAAANVPRIRVLAVTEHAAATSHDAGEVTVEQVAFAGARPHGRRFGTLVHAVLAAIDLDADRLRVRAVAELEGRVLGAPAEEVTAAVDTVLGALAHPMLRRAAAAGRCRREAPIAVRLDDGTLVEGVVDAAFEEAGGWTVVDFKTDVELAGRVDEYRRQVALYALAIARATGVPARGVLLRI